MNAPGYALWACCKIVEIAIVFLIFYRGLWRTWRSLTIYCIFRIVVDAASFVLILKHMSAPFFYLFWSAEIVTIFLKAAILCTIYRCALHSTHVAPRRMKIALACLYIVLTVTTGAAAADGNASWQTLPQIAIASNRVLEIVFATTLILTIAYSGVIGLKWSSNVLLVDAGLCFGTIASVGWYALHFLHPEADPDLRDLADRVAYLITVLIWLIAFLIPQDCSNIPLEMHVRIARYIDQLSGRRERNTLETTV